MIDSTKINAHIQAQTRLSPIFFTVPVNDTAQPDEVLRIAKAYVERNYQPAPGQILWYRILNYSK
jgi:hypothetical protein